jgi:hypothetical protein
MSYPDLGCYAECLECELCDSGLNGLDLDLDLDDYDFGDGLFDDMDFPDDDGGWFDDFELPPVYPTLEFTDGGAIFGVGGSF